MTTSRQMAFLSEILKWKPIPEDTLVYFRERLRHRLHAAILDAFARRVKERGLKQKDLALRIHKKRAQIARWLSTQSNLTVDSMSDLMVGLGMDFDKFPFTPFENTLTTKQSQTRKEKLAQVSADSASTGEALERLNRSWKRVQWRSLVQHSLVPATPRTGAALRGRGGEDLQRRASGSAKIAYLSDFAKKRSGQSNSQLTQNGIGR